MKKKRELTRAQLESLRAQTLQRVPKDTGKSGSGGDQTTERPLGACTRGVDQHAAAVEIAPSSTAGQGVNPLLQ